MQKSGRWEKVFVSHDGSGLSFAQVRALSHRVGGRKVNFCDCYYYVGVVIVTVAHTKVSDGRGLQVVAGAVTAALDTSVTTVSHKETPPAHRKLRLRGGKHDLCHSSPAPPPPTHPHKKTTPTHKKTTTSKWEQKTTTKQSSNCACVYVYTLHLLSVRSFLSQGLSFNVCLIKTFVKWNLTCSVAHLMLNTLAGWFVCQQRILCSYNWARESVSPSDRPRPSGNPLSGLI